MNYKKRNAEMLTLSLTSGQQIPLIHEVHSDDLQLLNTIEGEWFEILHNFPWWDYREVAALYYDGLYEFNRNAMPSQVEDQPATDVPPLETKDEGRQRLLFNRATMQVSAPILYEDTIIAVETPRTNPELLSPGVVPDRFAGRKPKCFFSLFKSFIGTSLMGFAPEPDKVALLLNSNPSFARICGFAPKDKTRPEDYDAKEVPALRKIEQFDQVMRQLGLWDTIKIAEVKNNLNNGVIKKENELVGDTTHYHAHSNFETVNYTDAAGKPAKKSQSKVTKTCRCDDHATCKHDWTLNDDGAGTVVKSSTKMYWAHKASVIGFPGQGVALDAVAITDASSHDGQTFFPHVEKIFEHYPEISASVDRVLYDSACDDSQLKERFQETLGVELKASFNPRRSKAVTKNLPRGMTKISPFGVPICQSGYEMDYQGARYEAEKFIYKAPVDDDGQSVCFTCDNRNQCCSSSNRDGRTLTIAFDSLPHIDSDDPPMAKRFKAIMKRRPSVERMIKRLKCDLGDAHLTKRGNQSFQASLDKTMIAYHLLLRHLH